MGKILVAEDDEVLMMLLKMKLEQQGHVILCAVDGREAMALIESESPDLIISDIMMPFVSGLEIISNVRNKLNLKIPILILSSAGQEKTVMEAFELGATDFISKPFSPNELSVRVKRVLIQFGS